MSIPPFVCNTPPPPDQCEDDRYVDDYEAHYSLSQDDEDGFGYGIAPYNYTVSTVNPTKDVITSNISTTKANEITVEIKENHLKGKDDENIQNIDFNIENISINTSNNDEYEPSLGNENIDSISTSEKSDITLSNKSYDISHEEGNIEKNNIEVSLRQNTCNNNDLSDLEQDQPECNDIIKSENECDQTNIASTTIEQEINTDFQNSATKYESFKESNDSKTNVNDLNEDDQQQSDDEFGDFEDFKAANGGKQTTLDDFNPWQNEASLEPKFQATFDTSESGDISTTVAIDDDDDFGEFDDFRSNTEIQSTVSQECDSLSSSLINDEAITKVVYSLFDEELVEPENSNIKKLESSLSVVWRQLLQVDDRQPYMVNWNSSITQKSLLKSLCIDSRNILFVPKWSSNTPRFAANLCDTPLQPQKPSNSDNVVHEPVSTSATSWVDRGALAGQESTYAEALLLDLEHLMATLDQMTHNHNQSALKISDLFTRACSPDDTTAAASAHQATLTAADLDMLDQPTKPIVYSATINVQPIRQISLPDTHIFTPSNSETPRSKTIHYDCGPTILMPASDATVPPADDDDFTDFQDFKEAPNNKPADIVIANAATSNAVETSQVLEPIKMDLTMPMINWPEPGQIKDTFDDFSDFVSNSKPTNERESAIPITNALENALENKIAEASVVSGVTDVTCEDDFDNFQSAIPLNSHNYNIALQTDLQKNDSAVLTLNSASASFSNDDFSSIPNSLDNKPPTEPNNFTSLPSKINYEPQQLSQILQPLSIHTQTSNKTKSGQILQPLSLESFSQINWPNPGIDFQDLSRFNPIETVPSLKNDCGSASGSKHASPARASKAFVADDDGWGEFVSIKTKPSPINQQKSKPPTIDEDEWSDFVSSSTVKPPNGLNTISFNVHTNQQIQNTPNKHSANQTPVDVPTLNYITPKSNNQNAYSNKHVNL